MLRAARTERICRLTLRLALSALLLWLVARVVPIDALLTSLSQVNPWLLLASNLSVPVIVYIDANRTRVLTSIQGMTHTVGELCRISFISSFYALILPGLAAGGLVRWHRLARLDAKPSQAFAVVMFGRILSTAMTVLLGLACWGLDATARAHTRWGAILFVIALALLALLWLLILSPCPRELANWAEHQHWLAQTFRSRLQSALLHAGEFKRLGRKRLATTALLLLANDLIAIGSLYLLALALHLPLSPVAVGWTRAYVLLLTILPISVLGLGVREGGLIAMLSTYHIDAASAVAYSTLILARTVLAGGLGALLEVSSVVWRRKAAIESL